MDPQPNPSSASSQPSTSPSDPPTPPVPARPAPQTFRRPLPAKPRKVRGGIKLIGQSGHFPESWPAQRWMRVVELAAPGESLVEGLAYAAQGQTRRMNAEPGRVVGAVQGRAYTAYEAEIPLPTFTHEQWERAVRAMTEQAGYAAKLLAGDLPTNIEDVFAPLGLHLFPAQPTEMVPSCTCREETKPWCKHACCLAYLAAERFATDPFLIFTLRGMPREELIERLRQHRSVAGSGLGSAPVYAPRVPGASDVPSKPLEALVDRFWEPGPHLQDLDLPIEPPVVSHPLLRRLGTSPFTSGRFPLVGLLATCYEVISNAALQAEEGAGPLAGSGGGAPDGEDAAAENGEEE